ncbi:hypothetical protein JQ631_24015 [Bradyrhizobium manausense]|uniref:hypothetical protein n=1 Tax=Bradyrhizobium manausense TaxID=989370 RepID=UPI001BAE2444|nr:hypothetical protein [Bradyrhizobium manausense]MBR0792162.1 hypothetical protein [Bradyrhizobium manausense]
MADDPRALAAELDRFADRLRRLERADDVIDSISNGGLLTVPQAAAVCEISDQTCYRWIADAERRGGSLGLKRATWLIGTERLLDYIEKYQGGLPARVKAKNRLRELWPIWSEPQD